MTAPRPNSRQAGDDILAQITAWFHDELGDRVDAGRIEPRYDPFNGDQWWLPCPRKLYLGDVAENPHREKGAGASFGHHTCWMRMKDGQPVFKCQDCTQGTGGMSAADFTEEIKTTLGLTVGNVTQIGTRYEDLREHAYPASTGGTIWHVKWKATRRRKVETGWRWDYQHPDGERIRIVSEAVAQANRDKRPFTANALFNRSVTAEAGLYNAAQLQLREHAVVVFCEGEKDADRAEQLIAIAGLQERYVACSAPVMSFGSGDIPASITEPFRGRAVVSVFDPDAAGERYSVTWPGALWEEVTRWSVVQLPRGEGDLSDWADRQPKDIEAAPVFVEMLEDAAPLVERPHSPTYWHQFPDRTQAGAPSKSSSLNVMHVLLYHPDLRGRLHHHRLTGQLVTIDVPFADGTTIWKTDTEFATTFRRWLAYEQRYAFSDGAFKPEVFWHVAETNPPYSPHDDLLATQWDGVGRHWQIFTDFIPLDCSLEQAGALGRMLLTDIVRALRGDPASLSMSGLVLLLPRDMAGMDLASALLPGHAARKEITSLKEDTALELVRRGAALIQLPASTVTRFPNRRDSMAALQASELRVGTDRLGAPSYLFVGDIGEDISDLPNRYFIEQVREDGFNPDGLTALMPQLIAEAIAQAETWATMPGPSVQFETRIERMLDQFETIGPALAYYVFHQVEPVSGVGSLLATEIPLTARRPVPKRQVSSMEFQRVMSLYLKEVYGVQRSQKRVQTEANRLCDAIWGAAASRTDLSATRTVHVRLADGTRVRGFDFSDDRHLSLLSRFLGVKDDDGDGGCTGQTRTGTGSVRDADQDEPIEEEEKSGDLYGCTGSPSYTKTKARRETIYVRAPARILGEEFVPADLAPDDPDAEVPGFLDALHLLSQPGDLGFDTESYPGDPDVWVTRERAQALRENRKPDVEGVRRRVRFENAAPRRTPCILTFADDRGRTAWVRLPQGRQAARGVIARLFAHKHPDCQLVAHNAVFEMEVLAAAGVSLPVECTMVAAKMIYAEAFHEDDQESNAEVGFVRPEEDIGIADPATGDLDLERLGPVGLMRRYGLKDCLAREFGEARDKSQRAIDWSSDEAETPEAVAYAVEDAVDALRLWALYRPAMEALGIWAGYRNLMDAGPAVAEINITGLTIDATRYEEFLAHQRQVVAEKGAELQRLAPGLKLSRKNFNTDMRWWLLTRLYDAVLAAAGRPDLTLAEIRAGHELELAFGETERLPTMSDYWRVLQDQIEEAGYALRSTRGRRDPETGRRGEAVMSTSKAALEALCRFLTDAELDPHLLAFLRAYRDWNGSATLLAGLGDGFKAMIDPEQCRIVGHHKIAGAVTGRQSCAEVNLQQVPLDGMCRTAFIAAPGWVLIVRDYSQVELRVVAVVAGDEVLIEVYRLGLDVHAATAAKCFRIPIEDVPKAMRKRAKAVNFGTVYGGGEPALADTLACSLDEAGEILDAFLAAYPGIAEYRTRSANAEGDIWIEPGRRVMAAHGVQGPLRVNYPIQGGAASVQHRALYLLHRELEARPDLRPQVRICAAIHDEILIEARPEAVGEADALLRHCMTEALLDIFPACEQMGRDTLVSGGVAESWAEKE